MQISALSTASSKSVLQSALVGQPLLPITLMPSCKTVSTTLSTTQLPGDRLAIPAIDRRISAGFSSQQDQQDGDFMETTLHAHARTRAHADEASLSKTRLARLANGIRRSVAAGDLVWSPKAGRWVRTYGMTEYRGVWPRFHDAPWCHLSASDRRRGIALLREMIA